MDRLFSNDLHRALFIHQIIDWFLIYVDDEMTVGMVQAWVGQKLVYVTFYEYFQCPIYKYLQ